MSFGKYLKDVKAQIRGGRPETVRKTVEARRQERRRQRRRAHPGRRPRKGRVDRGLYPAPSGSRAVFLELRVEDQIPERSSEVSFTARAAPVPPCGAFARRARLHQRQVDGGRLWRLEARGPAIRPPVHHDQEQSAAVPRAHMLPEVG